jgi:hypothetical protein
MVCLDFLARDLGRLYRAAGSYSLQQPIGQLSSEAQSCNGNITNSPRLFLNFLRISSSRSFDRLARSTSTAVQYTQFLCYVLSFCSTCTPSDHLQATRGNRIGLVPLCLDIDIRHSLPARIDHLVRRTVSAQLR